MVIVTSIHTSGIPMSHLLVAFSLMLAVLIAGLIWAWLVKKPQTAQYRSYRSVTSDRSPRNRAWDAAVSRARHRHHRPF